MSTGSRLREARKLRKIDVKDLAAKAGVAPSVIYDIERGDQESNGRMAVITDILQVRGRWLMDGVGPMELGQDQNDLLDEDFRSRYDQVKFVRGAILSGGPGLVTWEYEEIENRFAFRRDWLQKKGLRAERCAMHEVSGDSMADYIRSGDVVLLNQDDRSVRDGEVYGINFDGELRVKRLFKKPAGIEVASDRPSPRDREFVVPDVTHLGIIGRVVWRGG